MKITLQPAGSKLCGQCCVSMISGISLEDSVSLIGKNGGTYTDDLIKALRSLDHQTSEGLIRVKKSSSLPSMGILKVKWISGGSHWVVLNEAMVYDSISGINSLENFKASIQGRITSYLNIIKS